ncbi:MAG: S1C family serine protease [Propionibacteriaceae bacterium]|nr:S1C family serine protease [Propionibacteriaceae bacterium]
MMKKMRTLLTALSIAAMAAATIGIAATQLTTTPEAATQVPQASGATWPGLRSGGQDAPSTPSTSPSPTPAPSTTAPNAPSTQSPSTTAPWPRGTAPGRGNGNGGNGQGGAGSVPSASTTAATSTQTSGLVLINTVVDYGTAQAAGTGMVIESDGIVITNHHVVADSTQVSVTVPSTGKVYSADVLGYDTTHDVAVLQLQGASGLSTVTTNPSLPSSGQSITAVGNAEGAGRLVAAPGQVTDTGVSITVTEDDGSGTANLTNLIQVNAGLVPGDSGGALYDANNQVIGMNVAGSTNSALAQSYAIPISTVMGVADAVLAGQASSTITLGRTAALGITVSSQANAVQIVGVVNGGAAATAGITPGSVLTRLDGTTITDQTTISTILAQHQPGDKVSVSWIDQAGASHTATVTLGVGPLA